MINGTTVTTNANGVACVDGLLFGCWTTRRPAPGTPYAGETMAFSNTPLTELSVSVQLAD